MRFLSWASLAAVLCSCGPDPKPASSTPAGTAEPAAVPRVADESRRLPKPNLVASEVIDKNILGKTFLPGGTIGKYKKGKVEYQLFVAKSPSPTGAAIALSDFRGSLDHPKLIPSFGGYFGEDNGRPAFVFTKGSWIAGVVGLPEKEADAVARVLAAGLTP
ncbi:MAG: hypothetical protein ABI823_00710 [Bryobacteraceae bacterium]